MTRASWILEAHVAPNEAVRIPYTFQPNAAVKIQVFATQPVNVYMVDGDGLAAFMQQGGRPPAWAVSEGRTFHSLTARLPPKPQWNLLIVNPSPVPVTANYDVTIEAYGFGPTGVSGMSGSFP